MLHGSAHATQRLLKESLATVVLLGASGHDTHDTHQAVLSRGVSTVQLQSQRKTKPDATCGPLGLWGFSPIPIWFGSEPSKGGVHENGAEKREVLEKSPPPGGDLFGPETKCYIVGEGSISPGQVTKRKTRFLCYLIDITVE